MLKKGGIDSLPSKFISKAFGSNQSIVSCFAKVSYMGTKWYCFDPEHKVSQKVALRLGYQPAEALGDYGGLPTLIMHRKMTR